MIKTKQQQQHESEINTPFEGEEALVLRALGVAWAEAVLLREFLMTSSAARFPLWITVSPNESLLNGWSVFELLDDAVSLGVGMELADVTISW